MTFPETDSIDYRYVTANGVRLHLAEAGPRDGPLLFLLHGFPEYWFEWRDYIEPLARAGFHVIAPDQRGYNLSDKPEGVANYTLDLLAADIVALAQERGVTRFDVVGHDWGATVGWWLATYHPQHLHNLVAINAPHPAIWLGAMQEPGQARRSRYVKLLRRRWLPEWIIRLGRYRALEKAFETSGSHAFPHGAMRQYREAWRRRGALTAMLNWYRALFAQPVPLPEPHSVKVRTLVLWGDRDPAALPELADRSADLCEEATLKHFPDQGHWLPHDTPDLVLNELLAFLKAKPASDTGRSRTLR